MRLNSFYRALLACSETGILRILKDSHNEKVLYYHRIILLLGTYSLNPPGRSWFQYISVPVSDVISFLSFRQTSRLEVILLG
jgi:hypothetical protein